MAAVFSAAVTAVAVIAFTVLVVLFDCAKHIMTLNHAYVSVCMLRIISADQRATRLVAALAVFVVFFKRTDQFASRHVAKRLV